MDPAQRRGAGQQPIERLGREPAAQEHLDVADGFVGEALVREQDEPRARRSRGDPLEVGGPVARREDRGQGDGRRDPGRMWRAVPGHVTGRASPCMTRATQRSGESSSSSVGSVSGPSQSSPERRRAAPLRDARHEPLAALVLLELEVEAGQPQDRPLDRAAPFAPLVELGADPLDVRHQVAPDVVHHVVAEAFEQAHHDLRLAEQAALLAAHEPLHPVAAAVARPAQRLAQPLQGVAPERGRVPREARELRFQPRGEVRPQPRVGLEFERVGRLVERDPGPERVERHVERLGRLADVLLDEEQLAGFRLGAEQRQVVLAEHPLAHEPEHQARSGGS